MKNKVDALTHLFHSLPRLALVCLTIGCIAPCHAADASADQSFGRFVKQIQFGGFASQGYLINSGHNDYLGETSKGTFDFREYAVNASWSKGKWRLGAQAFGQELGAYGNDAIKLDWANVDYQPTQWLGLRAGRVKMPRGLYNEALDLDSVRPFVLLPQSVYDARLRDFNAAFNGVMVFGNVSLGRAGSVDYRSFFGKMPMSVSSGANDYFNGAFNAKTLNIGLDNVRGATLFWNLPINGLKAGYSYSGFRNLGTLREMAFGTSTLKYNKNADNFKRHLGSLEYSKGDWTFAAEAGREQGKYVLVYLGTTIAPSINFGRQDYWYISASHRVNRWLELGTYVSHTADRYSSTVGVSPLKQNDFSFSTKFDVNDHLLFKVEGHFMDGAGKIYDTPSNRQPIALRDERWKMVAAKMTYSF